MELSDLLVSYKRVDAPRFTPSIPIIEQFPSYQTPTDKETNTPSLPVQAKPTTSYSITSVQAPGFKAKWTSPYRDRNKWISDLTQAYRRAGITNDNALKMLIAQDALESAWGRSAQGKFNFGNLTTGAKWKGNYVTGDDKNARGQAIKQKFRSYNSMDEYAADKIQFLKRLYDFNENDDINKFTAKLTGSNKGKRRYAEATNYADSLTKVFNSFKNGGVIKAQTGRKVDFQSYLNDPEYSKRKFLIENMKILQDSLISRKYQEPQRLAILSAVGDETGGDPQALSEDKQFSGIIQWGAGRKPNSPKLGEQIHQMLNEIETPKSPYWSDGGGGLPKVPNLIDGYNSFWNSKSPSDAALYLNKGYVRPREESDRFRRARQATIMKKYLK